MELQEEDDLLWMREPFLSSQAEHGFLVVHGHTPTKNLKPDLRHNRLNLDTGACFGGPLTAAAFIDEARVPAAFVFDDGQIGEVEALDMKTARLDCKIELAGAFWQSGPLRPDAATRPVEGLERHRFEGLELQDPMGSG